MLVKNMTGQHGPVVNQFIINIGSLEIFQSYETIIAIRDNAAPRVYLDPMFSCSPTTSKYRTQFLAETTQRTRKKLKEGYYIGRDLNEANRSFTETMIRTACRPYFTNVKQSES